MDNNRELAAAIQAFRRNREAYERGPRIELLVLSEFADRVYHLLATGHEAGMNWRWWINDVDGMGTGGFFYEAEGLARRLGVTAAAEARPEGTE